MAESRDMDEDDVDGMCCSFKENIMIAAEVVWGKKVKK